MDRELKISAVQVCMKEMIRKGFFSICDAKRAAELLGVSFSTEQEKFMGLLHCVKFSDMPDDVKLELQSILEERLSSEPFEITVGRNLLGKPKKEHLRIGG